MKIKTKLKGLSCLILVILCLLGSVSNVSAHDAYFLGIGFDDTTYSYYGNYSFQSNNMIGDNHYECDISCTMYQVGKEGNKVPVRNDRNIDVEKVKDLYKSDSTSAVDGTGGIGGGHNYMDTDYSSNSAPLIFTFPGLHTKTDANKLDATTADSMLADRVASIVVPQLNEALNFCYNVTGLEKEGFEVRRTAANMVNIVRTQGRDNGGKGQGTLTIYGANGTTKSIAVDAGLTKGELPKDIRDGMPAGFEAQDYVKFSYDSNNDNIYDEEAYFIYQCWKGYNYPKEGGGSTNNLAETNGIVDPLARDSSVGNWYKKVGNNEEYKIGWNHIVLQGNLNLDCYGTGFSNLGDITPSNWFVDMIASAVMWLITSIRSFLMLYSIEDLMLNTGTRNMFYSMGLFHNNWVGPIYLLHIICQLIAWGCLGFAVMKILMKRQLATVNIGEKVSMMNDLKNLAICAFLLGSFPLLFNMIARINYSLVDLFNAVSGGGSLLARTTISLSSAGSLLVELVHLGLEIYFNFTYMLRAITIAILYAIAPLCIYTLALGGKYTKVYGAFMKELLSNIFIQTIHALMIAFFISVKHGTAFRPFEIVVVLYSFIPLSKFVKQNVFQMGDGIMGVAGGLTGGVVKGTAGAASGLAGGAAKAITPKGGGKGKAGGAGGGKGGMIGRSADLMSTRKAGKTTFSDAGKSFKDTADSFQAGDKKGTALNLAKGVGKGALATFNALPNSKAGHVLDDAVKAVPGSMIEGVASNSLSAGLNVASGMAKIGGAAMALGMGDEQLAGQMLGDGASTIGQAGGSIIGGAGQGINGAVSAGKNSAIAEWEAMKQLQAMGAKKYTKGKDGNNITFAGNYDKNQRKMTWDPKTENKMNPIMKNNMERLIQASDNTHSTKLDPAKKLEYERVKNFYAKQGVTVDFSNDNNKGQPTLNLPAGTTFDKINWDCPVMSSNGRQYNKGKTGKTGNKGK